MNELLESTDNVLVDTFNSMGELIELLDYNTDINSRVAVRLMNNLKKDIGEQRQSVINHIINNERVSVIMEVTA